MGDYLSFWLKTINKESQIELYADLPEPVQLIVDSLGISFKGLLIGQFFEDCCKMSYSQNPRKKAYDFIIAYLVIERFAGNQNPKFAGIFNSMTGIFRMSSHAINYVCSIWIIYNSSKPKKKVPKHVFEHLFTQHHQPILHFHILAQLLRINENEAALKYYRYYELCVISIEHARIVKQVLEANMIDTKEFISSIAFEREINPEDLE